MKGKNEREEGRACRYSSWRCLHYKNEDEESNDRKDGAPSLQPISSLSSLFSFFSLFSSPISFRSSPPSCFSRCTSSSIFSITVIHEKLRFLSWVTLLFLSLDFLWQTLPQRQPHDIDVFTAYNDDFSYNNINIISSNHRPCDYHPLYYSHNFANKWNNISWSPLPPPSPWLPNSFSAVSQHLTTTPRRPGVWWWARPFLPLQAQAIFVNNRDVRRSLFSNTAPFSVHRRGRTSVRIISGPQDVTGRRKGDGANGNVSSIHPSGVQRTGRKTTTGISLLKDDGKAFFESTDAAAAAAAAASERKGKKETSEKNIVQSRLSNIFTGAAFFSTLQESINIFKKLFKKKDSDAPITSQDRQSAWRDETQERDIGLCEDYGEQGFDPTTGEHTECFSRCEMKCDDAEALYLRKDADKYKLVANGKKKQPCRTSESKGGYRVLCEARIGKRLPQEEEDDLALPTDAAPPKFSPIMFPGNLPMMPPHHPGMPPPLPPGMPPPLPPGMPPPLPPGMPPPLHSGMPPPLHSGMPPPLPPGMPPHLHPGMPPPFHPGMPPPPNIEATSNKGGRSTMMLTRIPLLLSKWRIEWSLPLEGLLAVTVTAISMLREEV